MVKRESYSLCIAKVCITPCWLQAAASQPVAVAAGELQEGGKMHGQCTCDSRIAESRQWHFNSAENTSTAPLPPHTAQALASVFLSQKQLGQEGCASWAWQKSQIRSKRKDTHFPECWDRPEGMAGPGGALPGSGVTARWLLAAL